MSADSAQPFRGRFAMVQAAVLGLLANLAAGCAAGEPEQGADAGVSQDAGALDAGVDASRDAGGLDAADSSDAGPPRSYSECDPYSGLRCGENQKCQVVLDPIPDFGVDLYFGCVPVGTGQVGERLPCNASVPLEIPVGTDAVTHSCAEGAVCAVKDGFARCRPVCGREGLECGPPAELCLLVSRSPAVAACIPASGCDPVPQTGCPGGQACFLRSNAGGDWLGDCAPPMAPPGAPEPLAAGERCEFFDTCQAGAGCLRGLSTAGEFEGDRRCRVYCDPASPNGACTEGTACRALPIPPGATFLTPSEPGACFSPSV